MQNPVKIDFQGMKPREALRSMIAEHVAGSPGLTAALDPSC
jgi:hypothetical protein